MGPKASGWRKARGTILPMKAAEKMPYRRPRSFSSPPSYATWWETTPGPFRQIDVAATISRRHRPVASQAPRPVEGPPAR